MNIILWSSGIISRRAGKTELSLSDGRGFNSNVLSLDGIANLTNIGYIEVFLQIIISLSVHSTLFTSQLMSI